MTAISSRKLSRKIGLLMVGLFVVGIIGLGLWLNKGRTVEAAWFNDSWAYRTVYGISNSGSAVSNQKVKVDIDTATLIGDGKMKSACQDARFTDQNGSLLKFFIDSDEGPCDDASTDFYVLLPSIGSGDSSFYFYYGNPSAITGASNEFFAPTASLGVKLKGFWPLNETSGTRYDFAHANNLTDNNTVTQTTGHVASAGQFTASSGESLSITDNTSLSTGDIDFTLTAWVYLDSKSARRPIAGKFNGASASQEYLLIYSDSSDRFGFTVRNGGGSSTTISANNLGSPSTATWYYLVGWHDSVNNTLNIQVNNGTVDSVSYSSGVTDSTTAFEVGHYVSGDHFYMDGRVDAIGLWKKVLTSTERTQLYNGGTGLEFSYLTFTPSSGPTAGSEEKSVGPVAHWALDEGTGTVAKDSTVNGFAGTFVGTPVWQPETMCISGKCLKLNGTTDYITYGVQGTSSLVNTTGAMTLSAWIKPATGQNSDAQVISRASAYGLAIPSNTSLKFYFWGSDLSVNYTFNPGEWYHIAGVYDGVNRKFYVNGRLIAQLASSDPPSASGVLTVGYLYDFGSTKYFKGFIDEPKVYNYARSDTEIRLEFNSRGGGGRDGFGTLLGDSSTAALADGLVGYYRMEETSGNAYDDSGNLIELTNNNTTTYVAGKFGNGTEYVPASSQYLSTATTVSGVKTVSFWTNPDSTTNYFVSLRSDVYITASSGVLSATGFASPKIYVNGVLSTTIAADTWQHVTVTTETAIDANQFYIGRQGGNYYDGTLDEVRLYSQTLTPSKVVQVYEFAQGPVGYWNFEDAAQGSAVADVSGYGNNGSWNGTGYKWQLGKFGQAGQFNGSSNYVSALAAASLNLNRSFTLMAWIKKTKDASGIINYGNGAWYFRVKNTGKLNFLEAQEQDILTGNTTLSDNTWYHVAVTISGDSTATATIYLNGVADGSTTLTNNLSGTGLEIGREPTGADYFGGSIDEVKVYNYVRTQAQIADDMKGVGTQTSNLGGASRFGATVGYWDFDEGVGIVAHDRSGNGNNGTLSGMSSPASVGVSGWYPNGKFGKALSFDGSNDYVSLGNSSAVQLTSGTMTAWINTSSPGSSYRGIVAKQYAYGMFLKDGVLMAYDWGASTDRSSGINLADGKWHYVAISFQSGVTNGTTFYVDGVKRFVTTMSVSNQTVELQVGWANSASQYIKGQIDEVKIYNYALTPTEVQTEFNQTKALVLGSFSDTSGLSGGSVASNSASAIYCVPGDTASCATPTVEWELEEGVGTSVVDTSGNVLTGTWNGTAPFWGQGKQGWGGKSNGSDSYVETADSSLLNLTGSSFTIQYWIKTSSTGFSTPLMIRDTSGNDSGILGGLPINITTGKASFDTWNYSGNRVTGSVTINDGRWHHVVGTYSSGTGLATLYVDGVIDSSDTQTGSTANANKRLRVGANVGSAGAFLQGFSGSVDGVKVYNYARSPAQVAWDFNKGKAVSYYDFDECQGTVIHNSGVYGTVGTWSGSGGGTQTAVGTCTTSGTTAWYQGRSGKFNGSMNFDGTDDYIDLGNNENVDISGVISISAWVKVASFGSSGQYKGIVSKVTGSSPYGGYQLNTDADSGNRFGLGMNISGTWRSMQTNGTYQTGTWYHLVATYDGSLMKIYVNGKLNNTSAYSGSLQLVAQNAFIGKNGSDDANMRFSGQIDDVRIFSYPLTEVQVRQAYNEGFGIRFGPSSGTP